MRSDHARADRDGLFTDVAEASAGLVRFGDSLVTESAHYEAEPADEERAIVVTLSTADRDRHGDELDPAGASLENFRRNPVVLFAHRHDLPAVGKALWVRALPGRLVAKIAFARTRLGEELHALYSRGYMKAWSVGFIPVEWERIGGPRRGVRVSKWDLLEVSAVPVPANPEALSRVIASGEISEPVLVKSLQPAGGSGSGPDGAQETPGAAEPSGGEAVLAAFLLKVTAIERKLGELEGRIAGNEERVSKLAGPDGTAGRERLLEVAARAAGEVLERRIRALRGRI